MKGSLPFPARLYSGENKTETVSSFFLFLALTAVIQTIDIGAQERPPPREAAEPRDDPLVLPAAAWLGRNWTGAAKLHICPFLADRVCPEVIPLGLQQRICPSPPPQGSEGFWKQAVWKVLPFSETIPHPVFEKFLYIT